MTDDLEVPVELPRREQVDPFVGYKQVYLNYRSGKIVMGGDYMGTYGADATAECKKFPAPDPKHAAPDPDCTCGLYAMAEPFKLGDYAKIALATVELFGTVIVGEKGFRAGRQRITALAIRPVCVMCDEVGDERRSSDALYAQFNGEVVTLCKGHGEVSVTLNALERLELEQVSEMLGIPVEWCHAD